jgi:hypothetical protein
MKTGLPGRPRPLVSDSATMLSSSSASTESACALPKAAHFQRARAAADSKRGARTRPKLSKVLIENSAVLVPRLQNFHSYGCSLSYREGPRSTLGDVVCAGRASSCNSHRHVSALPASTSVYVAAPDRIEKAATQTHTCVHCCARTAKPTQRRKASTGKSISESPGMHGLCCRAIRFRSTGKEHLLESFT